MKIQPLLEARKNPEQNKKDSMERQLKTLLFTTQVPDDQIFLIPSDDPKFFISPNDIKNGIQCTTGRKLRSSDRRVFDMIKKRYTYVCAISDDANILDMHKTVINFKKITERFIEAANELGYDDTALKASIHNSSTVSSAIIDTIEKHLLKQGNVSQQLMTQLCLKLIKQAGFYAVINFYDLFSEDLVPMLITDPTKLEYITTLLSDGSSNYNASSAVVKNGGALDLSDWMFYIVSASGKSLPFDEKQKLIYKYLSSMVAKYGNDMTYDNWEGVINHTFRILRVTYGDRVWKLCEPYFLKTPTAALIDYALKINHRLPKQFESKLSAKIVQLHDSGTNPSQAALNQAFGAYSFTFGLE